MKYLIPIFGIVFLSVPIVAYAAFLGCPSVCTNMPAGQQLCCLLERIRVLLWYVGWFLALIVILIAGIMYITSGGDQEKVTKAKKFLTYGIIGVAIMLASSFILDAISGLFTGTILP